MISKLLKGRGLGLQLLVMTSGNETLAHSSLVPRPVRRSGNETLAQNLEADREKPVVVARCRQKCGLWDYWCWLPTLGESQPVRNQLS